ncbi:xanthine dehydrogenase [Pseudomonas floridensis]|uniref:Xanthine dehydrogenase n=1 Tax=Pseudomonas floridensis TaxID=1958950 RepID=A0A1X0N1N6_9PSED|nr:XdhC family protein [Pseudomonas floridensis]ORC57118.1 xanthine dehydrogenase [Pseudomonas floridensis]
MNSLDLQVVQQASAWLEQGQGVWLCTVLSTFGSAPRGPGALLVALERGQSVGSLSGGCVEDDFLERLGRREFERVSQIVRYGEGGLAPNLALPCGGVLDVLVEYFEPDCASLEHFSRLSGALQGHRLIVRQVTLGSSQAHIIPADEGCAPVRVHADAVYLRMGAAQRLLIAGLSPVAQFCASFAVSLGYEVIVCDPRPEVVSTFKLPGVTLIDTLPAAYIARHGCHEATAIVALTHDPRLDDLTLLEAVRTKAFYIGAMGSKRTSEKRMERIRRIGGLNDDQARRIHAPIGLNLGSKTPAEIALAVMSDIVRVRNGVATNAL